MKSRLLNIKMSWLRKIKHLKASLFILVLSVSNILVLSLVFSNYSGTGRYKFFSKSEDIEDLKSKISQNCKSEFQEILEGKRRSFICSVKLDQRHKAVNYELKTRFKVVKEGENLKIIDISGDLINGSQHITEADFCNDCFEDKTLTDDSGVLITEFMKEISILAEQIYEEAEKSSQTAYDNFDKKDKKRLLARIKERNCKGVWIAEDESFEEFDDAKDVLSCRLKQIHKLGDSLQVEDYYHRHLKKELWRVYREEGNEDFLEDVLNSFREDPYRYSLSVNASASLLKNYTRWKENFDVLDSLREKKAFVHSISGKIQRITNLMTQEQSEQDIYYLNEGFERLYSSIGDISLKIDKAVEKITPSSPPSNTIDYNAVSKEVQGL